MYLRQTNFLYTFRNKGKSLVSIQGRTETGRQVGSQSPHDFLEQKFFARKIGKHKTFTCE